MALSFTENSNHRVTMAIQAVSNNLAQGTLLQWLNFDTVTPGAIRFCGDKGPLATRWQADNKFRCQLQRATTGQSVDGLNANFSTSVWYCIVFTWDITNGGPKLYLGTLTSALADISDSPVDGSGTQNNDSPFPWAMGPSGADNFGGDAARMMVFNTDLSLAQAEDQRLTPHQQGNLVLWNEFGRFPTSVGTQLDLTGNGHTGTVTGATLVAHPDIRQRALALN